MAIDWDKGYSSQWRVYEVLPQTWADGPEIFNVEMASVERSCDGEAPLLESGSISLVAPVGAGFEERYLRLVMVAEQGGARERVEVCTLLCSSASGEVNRGVDALRITGRSVLWPASVARVDVGSYAPSGADGADIAGELLRGTIAAPVEVEGSFQLASHVVYDIGATVLSVVWDILYAGGFGIRISGDGSVHIGPIPTKPALRLDRARARLLHEVMPHELDWSDVPNRYVAIEGSEVAEAVNNDRNSPTSIVRRGYRHDIVDTAPIRIGGETLTAYCERRLEERSVAYDGREWSREWWPDVFPGDLVRATIASVGVDGDFRVIKQSLTCSKGITVQEQARKEVYSWLRT